MTCSSVKGRKWCSKISAQYHWLLSNAPRWKSCLAVPLLSEIHQYATFQCPSPHRQRSQECGWVTESSYTFSSHPRWLTFAFNIFPKCNFTGLTGNWNYLQSKKKLKIRALIKMSRHFNSQLARLRQIHSTSNLHKHLTVGNWQLLVFTSRQIVAWFWYKKTFCDSILYLTVQCAYLQQQQQQYNVPWPANFPCPAIESPGYPFPISLPQGLPW